MRTVVYTISSYVLVGLQAIALLLLVGIGTSSSVRRAVRGRRLAFFLLLAAWAFVVANRIAWTLDFDSLGDVVRGLQVSPGPVAMSLFMGAAGAIGVAVGWRRKDVAGHVLLLLAAVNYIAWASGDLGLAWLVRGTVDGLGIRAVADLTLQMLLVSVLSIPVVTWDLARGRGVQANTGRGVGER